MPAKTLMIQGTASSVGKSILVTALCRIFKQDGYSVAPFKSQNMSNNSFVTPEGGEIGRAQAVQAEASGIEPSVYMNPILLKPEADNRSQVVVLGKVARAIDAREYYKYTPQLLETVRMSLRKLRRKYDIVVIEGAGSPAEINLKRDEIVNMRIARMAKSPVLLAGDIDRGGVFASLAGTLQLLDRWENRLIRGFIINKFRGDIDLLKPGLEMLEKRTGKPVFGVIPYLHDMRIAQEDAVFLEENGTLSQNGNLTIGIVHLPRISNYDDFDPLEGLGCKLKYIRRPGDLADVDLIIIPGTKSTIADLSYIRKHGLDVEIVARVKAGTPLLGICGGYQMLGRQIIDSDRIEGDKTHIEGLGLLDMTTVMTPEKRTTRVIAEVAAGKGMFGGMQGLEVRGYEIHMGKTESKTCQPLFRITRDNNNRQVYTDGALNPEGNIGGTYIHGIFDNYDFALAFVNHLRKIRNVPAVRADKLDRQREYDRLACVVRANLDMELIYKTVFG
ncbi:MAG TPA: cobyric acid synthase [Dehalococcoidia bacterium]|nr:cobyric acid synthase [Dehalococcoidia bacterium]